MTADLMQPATLGRRIATKVISVDRPPDPPDPKWWDRILGLSPPIAWLLALTLFLSGIEYGADNLGAPDFFVPLVAAAASVPLLVAINRALCAWLLVTAGGIVMPLAFSLETSLPWVPSQIVVTLIVWYLVGTRHSVATLAVVWGLTILLSGLSRTSDAGIVSMLTVALVLGYLVGSRRVMQQEIVEGEKRREDEEMRRAILEERTRIARELHDVVAHHMSMVAVQAETAPFRIPDLSDEARQNTAEIASTARDALGEMRRLLGVLRSEDTDAERAPQPGLDRIDHLLDGARRAGLDVETTVEGEAAPLPPGLELSCYRIVQEALSNAMRHAPGAKVRVDLQYEKSQIRLVVANDPSDGAVMTPEPGPGHGLLGMRERVVMLEGTLAAGPTPDGGYTVEASLPISQPGSGA